MKTLKNSQQPQVAIEIMKAIKAVEDIRGVEKT